MLCSDWLNGQLNHRTLSIIGFHYIGFSNNYPIEELKGNARGILITTSFKIFDGSIIFGISKKAILYFAIEKEKKNIHDEMHRSNHDL